MAHKRVIAEDVEMMKALKARGLTQRAIADALNIPQSTVSFCIGQKGVRKPQQSQEAEGVRDLFSLPPEDPDKVERLIEKVQELSLEFALRIAELIKEELKK